MPALAVITLDDSGDSPVEFSPSSIDPNGVAHLYSEETSGFDSRMHLSLGVKLPKNNGAVARVTGKLVIPVMDPDDSALKIGETIGTFEFVIPKRASENDRQNIRAFVKNFLDDASVEAAVESLESIY